MELQEVLDKKLKMRKKKVSVKNMNIENLEKLHNDNKF